MGTPRRQSTLNTYSRFSVLVLESANLYAPTSSMAVHTCAVATLNLIAERKRSRSTRTQKKKGTKAGRVCCMAAGKQAREPPPPLQRLRPEKFGDRTNEEVKGVKRESECIVERAGGSDLSQ
jgi:hypothetical protein